MAKRAFEAVPEITWPESVTEIHVHLGGSVPLYRLWEIAIERGIRGMGTDYEDFVDILKIGEEGQRDLDSYLEVYDKVELIQSGPQAIRESVIIAIHRAYRTGGMVHLGPGGEGGNIRPLFSVRRLELRFNPLKRTGAVFLKGKHAGLYDADRVIKAACDAADDVERAFRGKIQVGLLCCFGRDMTHEANMVLASKVRDWQSSTNKLVGVDLAGSESVNTLSDPRRLEEMKAVFDVIGPKLGRTCHAGETTHVDLDTFIKTIEAIEPQRVAHPIVAYRAYAEKGDDRGLRLLKERDLVCELCVKSNLLTGAVGSLEEYGEIINIFDEFGIPYTFSTDAPSLQVTSLADEFLLLLRSGAASPEQILRAIKTAEERSFLPPASA